MLYNLRRRFAIRRFNQAIAAIEDTPPLRLTEAPWCFVSMVANDDVPMYLLSMKALYARIGGGRVVAIIDGDLPEARRTKLLRHIPGIELVPRETIPLGPCQFGGTWERLLYVLDRAADEYVVQVDSDTLPLGPDVDEVMACLQAGRAFTLADSARIVSMREAAQAAQAEHDPYIGSVAEALFDRYPDCDRLRYVRGSSGLAGFAKGGFPRAAIEEFHVRMEALVGHERWRRWGTEQCASNFAVANSPGAVVLPYPAYASFGPDGPKEGVKFFHFIGSYRFNDGFFAARGRERIAELIGAQAQPGYAGGGCR